MHLLNCSGRQAMAATVTWGAAALLDNIKGKGGVTAHRLGGFLNRTAAALFRREGVQGAAGRALKMPVPPLGGSFPPFLRSRKGAPPEARPREGENGEESFCT